jgi:hypothetical protein
MICAVFLANWFLGVDIFFLKLVIFFWVSKYKMFYAHPKHVNMTW